MRRWSESEQAETWDRFESGESLRSISRRLGRPPSTIRNHVVSAGWERAESPSTCAELVVGSGSTNVSSRCNPNATQVAATGRGGAARAIMICEDIDEIGLRL